MRDAFRLYLRYLGASLRGQMEYRASFVMQVLGHFVMNGIEFLAMYVLFERFGNLEGWTLPEAALFYGIVNVAFAVADGIACGFDNFGGMIRGGGFDRLLVRPRSTALQLAGQELQLRRIGRFLQGFVVLLWAAAELNIAWTPAKLALLTVAILGGACLFYGLMVLQATLAFWTTETLEVMNTVTYGGVETAQYPLTIYRPWFRKVFMWVIPLACINYFPAHALLDRPEPLGTPAVFHWLAPLCGVAFLTVSLQVWKLGVRRYCSTGS